MPPRGRRLSEEKRSESLKRSSLSCSSSGPGAAAGTPDDALGGGSCTARSDTHSSSLRSQCSVSCLPPTAKTLGGETTGLKASAFAAATVAAGGFVLAEVSCSDTRLRQARAGATGSNRSSSRGSSSSGSRSRGAAHLWNLSERHLRCGLAGYGCGANRRPREPPVRRE